MACVSSVQLSRSLCPAKGAVCARAPSARAVIARATDTPDPAASIKGPPRTPTLYLAPARAVFWAVECTRAAAGSAAAFSAREQYF